MLTTDEKAEFTALVNATVVKVLSIADTVDRLATSSREVFNDWKDIYPMAMNHKTGLADVKGFIAKIWDTFPGSVKTPKEGNPSQFYNWNTAEAKHGNRHARGLKAVYKWINDNISSLYTVDEVKLDEKGAPMVDEAGEPVTIPVPKFNRVVTEGEKELDSFLGMLSKVEESGHFTGQELAIISPIFAAVSARLRPIALDLHAKTEAALKSLIIEGEETTETAEAV